VISRGEAARAAALCSGPATLPPGGRRWELGSQAAAAFAKQLKRADPQRSQLGAADRGRGIEQGVVDPQGICACPLNRRLP